nr:immunoglobulin heavy chain junction region [Mus musculus]
CARSLYYGSSSLYFDYW